MSQTGNAPKVFISHASEDKDRFVLDFATRLRSNGVDAWVDAWEMKPGDSLIDKIFEEGIKEAAAFIVVLSKHSVEKPWVREELNTAVLERIGRGTQLIPVVIDDCVVPQVLRATVWQKIDDLRSYQGPFDRIMAAIFKLDQRPPLGPQPSYASQAAISIGGLTATDNMVMEISCKATLAGEAVYLDPVALFDINGKKKLPDQALADSLEVLNKQGGIEILRTLGGKWDSYRVSEAGFELYARVAIPDYAEFTAHLMRLILNEGHRTNVSLQEATGRPLYLIDHILRQLEHPGLVTVSRTLSSEHHFSVFDALLRRRVQQLP